MTAEKKSSSEINILDLQQEQISIQDIVKKVKHDLDSLGYIVLRSGEFSASDKDQATRYFLEICQQLGEPISHDVKGTIVWDIKKSEHSASDVQTFSEHSYEAELHTDTQYRDDPEDYMALLSLVPATCGGGESLILSIRDIYQELSTRADADNLISTLENVQYPFIVPSVFRLNGNTENEYVFGPIFKDGHIRFRVDTIEKALVVHEKNLPTGAVEAFYELKKIVLTSEKIKTFTLLERDILFLNNKTMLHGRTAFLDENRHLLRIRMKRYEK